MSNFTDKNNARKSHKGGDRQHIEARRMRRILGGAFGKDTGLASWGWNDLIVGTTGKQR